MSSPILAPPRRPAHDPAALAGALVSVAECSFFAYAEVAESVAIAPGVPQWYRSTVTFKGSFAGSVTLTLPVELAHELWASFLGIEPGTPIDEVAVCDLVGEMANMATGSWLTGRLESSCFDLAHPDVQPVGAAPTPDVVVMINEQPVAVVLRIEPSES